MNSKLACDKNFNGETPCHVAVREGNSIYVQVNINIHISNIHDIKKKIVENDFFSSSKQWYYLVSTV